MYVSNQKWIIDEEGRYGCVLACLFTIICLFKQYELSLSQQDSNSTKGSCRFYEKETLPLLLSTGWYQGQI